MGRSKKVWGPYKDKTGKPMLKNGYSLVIGANDHFVGNGHGSQIIRDDAGQDWLLYHGFSRSTPENGRILLLDQIKWNQEGWPYVEEDLLLTKHKKHLYLITDFQINQL